MIRKNNSSRLRHRLTLQEEIATADTAGGYVNSWQDITDLWAEIATSSSVDSKFNKSFGRKILFAGQVQSEITHKVILRYRDNITTAMRLVFENRVFNIRAVNNIDENNQTLELLVQEGMAT